MKIGLATLGFGDLTNEEMAALAAEENLDCVQLFLAQKDSKYFAYNKRADVTGLTTDECKRIADAYRSKGIDIPSIGVYTNLIEPDDDERQENINYFTEMMRVATDMGISMLATECGKVQNDLGASLADEAYPRLVESTKKLIEQAEKYGVTIVFEPFFHDLLATAKGVCDFIEEINHPRVRVQLDPANLLPHNSLDEMFNALVPYVKALHAKDRKLHITPGVPAGEGDLDYAKFVALCRQYCPDIPLVIEYVNPSNYKQALEHLRLYL
ncbi:MAG: sugar phosphate isomerase/epimerase [Planctomycetes bacterium]|nr:sugar phosphate isomerase/epimerase [Planctomycetota bacterium]